MKQKSAKQAESSHEESSAFEAFTQAVDYSFINKLRADPDSRSDGNDHEPRQVFSGHYVPVAPSPLNEPIYVSHSSRFFSEIGLSDELVVDEQFVRMFSGDLSTNQKPLKKTGWATGYALSIYGTEYIQQCPFQTGNGYGDGRALSIVEVLSPKTGKRWEMQLKGGGPTPYCRGADGRAVLRSSVREFLAQEFMHALGIRSSRSLSLFVSATDTVKRPWYSEGSKSHEPDIMVDNPVAISTRVAPSFLRVGQLELFARRARSQAHPEALEELRMIVAHAIEREYGDEIDSSLPFAEQVVELAHSFSQRLIELVGHWLRVGYCQGNFNSDNCAVGGYTLDYGPFGFMAEFTDRFQPWTGGGAHFSFFNQPVAATANFYTFCGAVSHLIAEGTEAHDKFTQVREGFASALQQHVRTTWASKLGLKEFEDQLLVTLFHLMQSSKADFTLFFRELSKLPVDVAALAVSFSVELTAELQKKWVVWLDDWRSCLQQQWGDDLKSVAQQMQKTNPKYTWREWLVAPAYQQAAQGDYSLIHELQSLFDDPYGEQSPEREQKYYRATPAEMSNLGGISHYSCAS